MKKIEDVILFQIDLTSKVSKQYSQKEFNKNKLGITVEQWIILKIISESSNLSQRDIAEKSYRDTASITRTIDLLEKKELLLRKSLPNNRRTYHVCLTKKGQQFIDNNMKLIQSHRNKSIENLTTDELNLLSNLLLKIRKNMA
ncbi:MarR family transcriptional regulator [Seonamhaeicola sp. ML3]|uniref:MarR family transcriptional regulator n=1 Tax=Seonamhaeicola sp. ML3 TaxID=2937786 RepID=UPI00200CEABB|nr:MarR family transcriptional regulator [Seonamhaeicola sp. ML3]